MNIEEQVAGLLAREEIRDLVTARFSTTVDWLDLDGMRACFVKNSKVFFGDNCMSGDEFCDFWAEFRCQRGNAVPLPRLRPNRFKW